MSDNLRESLAFATCSFLLAVAAILFYWIRMKVVQQLTCLI